ncbi:MAG: response regulator transcription factor [Anaerolineales bacterium]|nr:response regulator transcription factor [Anaerolineales bacterium]
MSMVRNAIILTPSKGFGEMVRQLLADSEGLTPQLLYSPAQALSAVADGLDLLVLDTDFADMDIAAYLQQLRQVAPNFDLILILAEDTPVDGWEHVGAQIVLPQPFYLPDLAAAIEQLYGPLHSVEMPATAHFGSAAVTAPLNVAPAHEAPAWLADTKLSAQHLAQLSLESASQAALITRGAEVWAYAGELPRAAAEELAAAISNGGDAGADLARFVRLEATQADYMLYATALGNEYKLALVFDTQVPFSKMRSQVDKMAAAIAAASEASLAEVAVAQAAAAANSSLPAAPAPAQPSQPAPEAPAAQPTRVRWLPAAQAAAAGGSPLLSYAYVLTPRLPEHRLEGDLAEKLAAWLPQLCVAFAWRLEHLSIQPGFVQWMVSLPAETAPESVVHTLETHLSERIFDEFARLKRDNPSGEFFAPGFLVMNGGLPNDAQVADFIAHTRSRQGIPNQ